MSEQNAITRDVILSDIESAIIEANHIIENLTALKRMVKEGWDLFTCDVPDAPDLASYLSSITKAVAWIEDNEQDGSEEKEGE